MIKKIASGFILFSTIQMLFLPKNIEATTRHLAPEIIAAGGNHTVSIRSDGMLWAWGNNSYGQLKDLDRR